MKGLDKFSYLIAPITEEKRHADRARSFAPLILENMASLKQTAVKKEYCYPSIYLKPTP